MIFEDILNFFLGLIMGFTLCYSFIVLPILDDKEESCYQYYKDNDGYILDSCKEYENKWSDFYEQRTKKK